jgi:hypothetical protein
VGERIRQAVSHRLSDGSPCSRGSGATRFTQEREQHIRRETFLASDVINGKTEVAQILERKRVPFVFISGSPQEQLPSDLRSVPFIPKPFYPAQIERVLQAVAD